MKRLGVVILVPWRESTAERSVLWKAVRPHLEAFGWPLFLGDSEGAWSRGAAINRAAELADSWDVALIADADTIPFPPAVRTAVDVAMARRGAVRPHDTLYLLNRAQTRVAIRRGVSHVRILNRQRTQKGGGLLVVSHAAFGVVGGYDERYVGWGHEDSDINTRLLARADWTRIAGPAWHLFHQRDSRDTPQREANWRRMQDVQAAHSHAIARASARHGYDVGAIL